MMRKILFALAIFFLFELLVLFQIADLIGGLNTFILMLVAMFIGFALVKARFRGILNNLSQGQFDVKSIFLPLAGFLFLFPGFISDILALLLLIPGVQHKGENFYSNRYQNSNFFFSNFTQLGDQSFTQARTDSFTHASSENNEKPRRQGQTIDVKARRED